MIVSVHNMAKGVNFLFENELIVFQMLQAFPSQSEPDTCRHFLEINASCPNQNKQKAFT